MKMLVTGAAGFIAARTTELLLEQGHEVVGIDNINDAYDIRLKEYRLEKLQKIEGFTFEKIDIENKEALQNLFQNNTFDAVLNLAARAGVRYSMENPYVYLTTNALGTLNILECMKDVGVKKHVLASTSSLYAGLEPPYKEDMAANEPLSPYAASKKAAESYAYVYHHLYGIDTSVVRYFTVYGPAGRPDMAILKFIKKIDAGEAIELYGDGTHARDFTYVDDIARGTIAAVKPLGFETINLGGGLSPVLMKDLIVIMEKELGKEAQIDYQPAHDADMKVTAADISKAKELLGWNPEIEIEEGMRKTVDWYKENKDFVQRLEF